MTNHILPIRVYVAVFASLMVLLGATVGVTQFDMGVFNGVISLTIAFAKMLLVLLFFMHVRYTGRLIWIYVGASLFWLMLLLGLTMSDYLSRGW